MSDPDIGERLLALLRERLNMPDLGYAEPLVEIVGGYEARTFSFRLTPSEGPFASPLILRLHRGSRGPELARFEQAVQNAVADEGYPAPRVLLTSTGTSPLGRAGVVMERIAGRPLLDLLRRPSRRTLRIGATLAESQAHLHSIDTTRTRDALERERLLSLATVDGWLKQLDGRIDRAGLHDLRAGLDWLRSHRPEERSTVVCHGDHHPSNVLIDDRGVSGVIDWSLMKLAEPELDIGNTRVIVALGARDVPAPFRGIAGVLSRNMARRYFAAYKQRRPVDGERVRYYEGLRCLASLVWAGEHRVAAAAGDDPGPNPWAGKAESNRLRAHFRTISGIELNLPSPA